MSYAIRSVSRGQLNERVYRIGEDGDVEIVRGEEVLDVVDHSTIGSDVAYIRKNLKVKAEEGSLDVETSKIKKRYQLDKITADSQSKTDITVEYYDDRTQRIQKRSFSIKSFVGSRPTLFNASQSTNFVYKIVGDLTDKDVKEINSMFVTKTKADGTVKKEADISGRIKAIYDKGCELEFEKLYNPTFDGNLRVVDSSFPEIVADLLLDSYKSGITDLTELTKRLSERNPMGFKGPNKFYKPKICKFLMDAFKGMTAAKVWNDQDEVQGGYIVVKKDCTVVCYLFDDRNKFEEYLLSRSFLERPSAKRHKYATVFKEDGEYFINLNLDVRMSQSSKNQ